MYDISTLKEKKLADLQEIAKKVGLKRTTGLKKTRPYLPNHRLCFSSSSRRSKTSQTRGKQKETFRKK